MSEDLSDFISEVKRDYRGEYDLSKQEDAALVHHLTVAWYLRIRCVARILCMANGKPSPSEYKSILDRTQSLTQDPLLEQKVYEIHPVKTPIEHLVILRCFMDDLDKEFHRRTKNYPLGRAVLVYLMGKEIGEEGQGKAWLTLMSLLYAGKRRTPLIKLKYKGYEADDELEEVQRLALETVGRKSKELGESIKTQTHTVLPAESGLDLPVGPKAVEETLYKHFKAALVQAHKDILPVLSGEVEKVAERVRDAIGDYWKKGKAQKRSGKILYENMLDEKDAEEYERPSDTQERTEQKEKQLDAKSMAEQVIAIAKEEFGEKGEAAFKLFLTGDYTEKEIAARVGITDRTWRTWKKKLKKIFEGRKRKYDN